MRGRFLSTTVVVGLFEGAACSPFEATPSSVQDAGVSGANDAAGGLADGAAGGDGAPPGEDCASSAGPRGVRVGTGAASFCIDTTEVTNAQYALFQSQRSPEPSDQPPRCQWNLDFKPNPPAPSSLANYPVVYIDWCDAHAFCVWAGKRLCGRIGGGLVDSANAQDSRFSQWMFACTNGTKQAYPYGASYDPTSCNTNTSQLREVASLPACVGPVPGLFDMSGNAEELEDNCMVNESDPSGAMDDCDHRGGSFKDGDVPSNYGCANLIPGKRNRQSPDVGFRCCWP